MMDAMDNTDLLDAVISASEWYERVKLDAQARLAEARKHRDAEIRKAAPMVRQVDLVKASGLTRESIRRIVGEKGPADRG